MASVMASLVLPGPGLSARRMVHGETAARLAEEVVETVRDPAVSAPAVIGLFDRALLEIAGRLPLPALATRRRLTVAAGCEAVKLPADFHRGPLAVFLAAGGGRLILEPDLSALLSRPGPASGRPLRAALQGGRLVLRPAPRVPVELELLYQRLPEPLAAPWAKPECLPPHLWATLLVSFACREILSRIEEGLDGRQPGAARHGARFEAAMAGLAALIGPVVEEPAEVIAAMDWRGFGA